MKVIKHHNIKDIVSKPKTSDGSYNDNVNNDDEKVEMTSNDSYLANAIGGSPGEQVGDIDIQMYIKKKLQENNNNRYGNQRRRYHDKSSMSKSGQSITISQSNQVSSKWTDGGMTNARTVTIPQQQQRDEDGGINPLGADGLMSGVYGNMFGIENTLDAMDVLDAFDVDQNQQNDDDNDETSKDNGY